MVLTGRGPTVEATGQHQLTGHARFEAKLTTARKSGDHFWVALAYYVIDDPSAAPIHLDLENIGGSPALICYRCETPYEPRLLKRRCKGDTEDG
jgi:hypothetical protein